MQTHVPCLHTGVVALKDTIRASLRMKRVGRMTLDGDSLADLMQTWAANMNVKLGSFQTSQQDLLSHVQSSKMAAITLEYRHEMDAVLAAPQHKFPISPKQLTAVHQNATSAAMATLTRTDPDFLQVGAGHPTLPTSTHTTNPPELLV